MELTLLGLAIAAQVFGLLSIALCVSLCVKFFGGFAFSGENVFNFHPFFMVLGMIFLYGNSVIIYRVLPLKKFGVKIGHAVINLVSFIMAVLSLVAVFKFHNLYEIPHLYSLHSWFGIITVSLFPLQFLVGFGSFLFPGLPSFVRTIVMPYHQMSGKILFFFATVSTLTGLMHYADGIPNYVLKDRQSYLINFLSLSVALFATLIAVIGLNDKFKRREEDEDGNSEEETFVVQSS